MILSVSITIPRNVIIGLSILFASCRVMLKPLHVVLKNDINKTQTSDELPAYMNSSK